MTDLRWRALLGVALILSGGRLRADDSPPKPDLAGYRTVKDAATRAIVPPRAGLAGQTGYLGVSTIRDDQGRLVVEEVQPDSPAAKAGVEKGDVVVQRRWRDDQDSGAVPGVDAGSRAGRAGEAGPGPSRPAGRLHGDPRRRRAALGPRTPSGRTSASVWARRRTARASGSSRSRPTRRPRPPGSKRAIGSSRSRGSTSPNPHAGCQEILIGEEAGRRVRGDGPSRRRGGRAPARSSSPIQGQGATRPGAGRARGPARAWVAARVVARGGR